MCKAYNIETMSPSNPVQEWRDVAHLTEWAQREKLGARFESGIEALVKQGGLCTTTDKFLEELGYRLPAMRKKIMEAIKTKFRGNRKVRFGQIVKHEPILKKRPNGKCPWTEIDHIEVTHDNMALRAAVRTWRFCATGFDGLEEEALMRKAFQAMKPEKAGNWVVPSHMFQTFWCGSIGFFWILHFLNHL
jgi:selenocysteine lyase/cysteine desulfurase